MLHATHITVFGQCQPGRTLGHYHQEENFLYAHLKNGRIMPWQCPSVRPSEFSGIVFQHTLRYQFETWSIHLIGSATHRVRVWSQSGYSDLFYSHKFVRLIFLHLWPQELYIPFTFGAFLYMFWDMDFKPGIYIRYGAWHIKFESQCN